MPRTKGSKNHTKSDIASQIAEKQSVIQTLTAEVEEIQKDIEEKKADLKAKKSELKSAEKEVVKLEAKTEADVSKFLKQLHAQVLEKMLEGEMDAHLGYEKNSVIIMELTLRLLPLLIQL